MTSDIIIPDVPEPIIGYRIWQYNSRKHSLEPMIKAFNRSGSSDIGDPWAPRNYIKETNKKPGFAARSACRHGRGDATVCYAGGNDKLVRCGLHCYDSLESLMLDNSNASFFRFTPGTMILGTVWLWGKVFQHETGYRSEYARVRSLTGYLVRATFPKFYEVLPQHRTSPIILDNLLRLRDLYGAEGANDDIAPGH